MTSESLVGNRIVVTGMSGSGKSTFSKLLAIKTGLPLIHLDLHIWNPGWVRVSETELLAKQRLLMAADEWLIDSNDVDDDLLLERADTLIVLATPWWICSWRAFLRGLRRPPGSELPEGCAESHWQRVTDEWGIVWRNWRNRHLVAEHNQTLVERCGNKLTTHVLASKQDLKSVLYKNELEGS